MMNARHAILTLACFGLLSTAAMGMPQDDPGRHISTPNDALIPASPGMSANSGMSSDSGMAVGTDRQKITGEILRVQDELYVVKDSMGKEVSLHVDDSTQKSGELKEGDRIEAEITKDGHAFTLKKSQDMN